VAGATTATGHSPLRPRIACNRSACSSWSADRSTAAAWISDDQRQLVITASRSPRSFSATPAARPGQSERAAVGRTDRRPDGADLVPAWKVVTG